jgi:3-phosphoshikimate 1-carboxyvinyltransferase
MIQAAKVSSHHDHRIAMAAAVSALRANGPVEITHAEAVHKSYPTFYSDIQMLGAAVSLFN